MLSEGFLQRVQELFLEELSQALPDPEGFALELPGATEAKLKDFARRFHGLAGAAGLAHYHTLSGFFHTLEELMSQMAQGQLQTAVSVQLSGEIFPGIHAAVMEMAKAGGKAKGEHLMKLRELETLLGMKQAAQVVTPPEASQTTRVLVVDDDRVSLYVIEEVLKSAGYEIVSTMDPANAVAMAKDFAPDLIILDVVMGDISGYDLARKMRSDASSQLTPIILVSVKADVGAKIEGFQSGATDYLAKPFAPAELLARVSAIMERTRMFKDLALRDGLTGAFNHRYLQERLDEELNRYRRTRKPFSIAMLDLDHFKQVNDQHGHQVGDLVLTNFAQLLKKQLREMDVVARYGGEEFVVIMLEAAGEDCAMALDRVRETMAQYELAPGLTITFSGGMVMVPRDGLDKKELLHLADLRLYEAKHNGRNRLICQGE